MNADYLRAVCPVVGDDGHQAFQDDIETTDFLAFAIENVSYMSGFDVAEVSQNPKVGLAEAGKSPQVIRSLGQRRAIGCFHFRRILPRT